MVNVPTINDQKDIIIEVGATNKHIYILGVLDIPPTENIINNSLFKNGTLFEHIIEPPVK